MPNEVGSEKVHGEYACPGCRACLTRTAGFLRCEDCGASYELEDGIADFSGGRYYDKFVPGQELSEEQVAGLDEEVPGAVSRIEDFYLPLLRKRIRKRSAPIEPVRVLDSGCGNGLTVDLLNAAGFQAWGSDYSALRKWQWRGRECRSRLSVADGSSLPFRDGYFDAVISSGVLEHIGVRESGGEHYKVEPLPDRDERRQAYLRELLRVVAPGGRIWIDFPNGAFPIDFWHGTTAAMGTRWHNASEGFLPTLGEVRRDLKAVDPRSRVKALSPHGRLGLKSIRKHWYGRVLNLPARLYLWIMTVPGPSLLAGTCLNPFLVLEIALKDAGR